VIDGVTMGHTCCVVQDCPIPLTDQQDWFCIVHRDLRRQCCVNDCNLPVETRHITCGNPLHRAFEHSRDANPAIFVLRRRMDRAGLAEIPVAGGIEISGQVTSNVPLTTTTHTSSERLVPLKQLPKGRLSRRWTHNEQLFVRPCGVIISRATFFGSEGVSGVKVHILRSYEFRILMFAITGFPQGDIPLYLAGLPPILHFLRQ
jgi:hypothetical protein